MRHFKLAIATVVALMFVGALPVKAQSDPLAGLDAYLLGNMQQWGIPGVAVAVIKDDRIALAKGYGTRTFGKQEPVDENTLFAIGSQTKYFTANALAILVAEGKIDWDDLMTDRLSGFQVMDDLVTSHATLTDVLAHRTGSERGDGAWWSRPSLSRHHMLALMKYLKPEQPFRSSFIYNNLMFVAAGEVIPVVTGVSWDEFIETRIFKPLGMKNSNTSIRDFGRNRNVATPHEMSGNEIVSVPYRNIDNVGPAGAINSSALEMAQWLRLQLNNGKVDGRVVVPETTLNDTRRIHNPVDRSSSREFLGLGGMSQGLTGYGLGIRVSDYGGYRVYSHGGGIDGMNSFSAFIPELDLGVIVLVNMGSQFAMPLTAWILDRYADAKETDWIDDSLIASDKARAIVDMHKDDLLKEAAGRDAKAALRIGQYAGVYENDFMGKFTIIVKGGALGYSSGDTVTGDMTYLSADTFYVSVTEPLTVARWGRASGTAQFSRDADGSIEAFILQGRKYERKRAK